MKIVQREVDALSRTPGADTDLRAFVSNISKPGAGTCSKDGMGLS